jgi:hypothetical protein
MIPLGIRHTYRNVDHKKFLMCFLILKEVGKDCHLPGTNTLVGLEKKFITLRPWVNVIKLFTAISYEYL